MKVCPLCGESYGDPIDFCFRDGEVLTSPNARQTPSARPRNLGMATPALAPTATPSMAPSVNEPDVTRANRQALMRAAAATYLAPGQAAPRTPTGGLAREVGPDTPRATPVPHPPRRTPVPLPPLAPLDQGMGDHGWDGEGVETDPIEEDAEAFDEEPFDAPQGRAGAIVAAVIGALVVLAAALGIGLLVVVGLGRRPSSPVTAAAMVEPPHPLVQAERVVAPAIAPSGIGDEGGEEIATSVAPPGADGLHTPPANAPDELRTEPGPRPAAAEFRVVLPTGGANDGALLLHVDGVAQGVLPARVMLTPGDHVFRVTNGHSGASMLEVTRTIDTTSVAEGTVQELDLSR